MVSKRGLPDARWRWYLYVHDIRFIKLEEHRGNRDCDVSGHQGETTRKPFCLRALEDGYRRFYTVQVST